MKAIWTIILIVVCIKCVNAAVTVRATNLHVSFPRPWLFASKQESLVAIRNETFCIDCGPGVISLVGLSGAGKSTFLKVLSGRCQPSSGEITVESSTTGKPVAVTYVDRQYASSIISSQPIHGAIVSALEKSCAFDSIARTNAAASTILLAWGLALNTQDRPSRDLLRGDQLRFVLAFAYACQYQQPPAPPPLLLLDELLDLEDGRVRASIEFNFYEAYIALGVTVFTATHKLDHAARLAAGTLGGGVMYWAQGEMKQYGPPMECVYITRGLQEQHGQ